jgi:hypothetical protein
MFNESSILNLKGRNFVAQFEMRSFELGTRFFKDLVANKLEIILYGYEILYIRNKVGKNRESVPSSCSIKFALRVLEVATWGKNAVLPPSQFRDPSCTGVLETRSRKLYRLFSPLFV